MKRRAFLPLVAGGMLVSACGSPSKFLAYNGPQVTRIIVEKSTRSLWLMSEKTVLKKYDVELGFTPLGHKQIEGDGKTPEGSYLIDRRNPNSNYHLSIGLSYPNAKDTAKAKALGEKPGGEIFIYGGPTLPGDIDKPDWTAGCISVSNEEMEEIYAMVKNGTQIDLLT